MAKIVGVIGKSMAVRAIDVDRGMEFWFVFSRQGAVLIVVLGEVVRAIAYERRR